MATVSKWVVRVALVAGIGLIVYGAISADSTLINIGVKALIGAAIWHWTEPLIQRRSQKPVDDKVSALRP